MSEPYSKETQLARVWTCKDGNEGCTRSQPCRPCLGRRNRRKGMAKQRVARKALGVPDTRFHGQLANEENWRGIFRGEVKAGQQVKAMTTRFLAAEKQSDQNKAIGDTRPFAFVAMPDGSTDGLVCVRLSVWRQTVVPALLEHWGTDG